MTSFHSAKEELDQEENKDKAGGQRESNTTFPCRKSVLELAGPGRLLGGWEVPLP